MLPEDHNPQHNDEQPSWIIKDWMSNIKFNGKEFKSFDDAEDFLCIYLNDNYETDRQEYYIVEN